MIDEFTLSDEEKSFQEWITKVTIQIYDLELVRKAFIDGYASGWSEKQKNKAEEYLQK